MERITSSPALVHLREGRDAAEVAGAIANTVRRLPSELVRSISWHQGREMAHHALFSVATGVGFSFCDPRVTR